MDDDDYEDDEMESESVPDALGLGQQVIVTTDDGYETGVILGSGEAGVRLKVTHKVVRVEPSLSKAEKVEVEAAVAGLSRRELYVCGWEILRWRVAVMKRATVEEMVREKYVEAELAGRATVETLKPLTRTVATFLPWHSIVKIVSFSEWQEEQMFRPFEASLAGAGEE